MIFHTISGVHEFVVTHDMQVYIFLYNTPHVELEIRIRCIQPGTHADIHVIHLQKNNDILKLTTLQQHDAPHTSSSIVVKGALYDQANFNYSGKIYVSPESRHTRAEQKSHTLLLSEKAHAQAMPALEVLTNDVQCKHGSAVAGINANLIEYLASRGITQDDSQEILVKSFFLSALEDKAAQEFFLLNISDILIKSLF
ncbi:MAG: SufD family Fe-S cluster assembly protein [Candidatus Babeliaceae bacterium]|nr:SufD family Fe-S cluster assembly protein [Candidatus Babeliaceae bacterium]